MTEAVPYVSTAIAIVGFLWAVNSFGPKPPRPATGSELLRVAESTAICEAVSKAMKDEFVDALVSGQMPDKLTKRLDAGQNIYVNVTATIEYL